MLTTTTQRIALVIGAFWTLLVVSATLTEIFEGSGWGKSIGGAAIGGVPTAVLWHFTGVLCPVLNRFRGS